MLGLLAAAVVAGGVFVPLAIREGASNMLRWLGENGEGGRIRMSSPVPGRRRRVRPAMGRAGGAMMYFVGQPRRQWAYGAEVGFVPVAPGGRDGDRDVFSDE